MVKNMKTLDYIFIACFGLAAMMLINQILQNIYIASLFGVIATSYCFIAVNEDIK